MREQLHAHRPDAALGALAARQHGVVSYRQLIALGLSRQAIDHRVRAGRLHRIHRGVYAVGHKRLTQRGRWMAAVLAGGEDAVLSHRTAAALWQILPARGPIDVASARRLRRRDGIAFHSQVMQVDEVTNNDRIPVTTVARTLLDLAATEPAELERAFNEAEFRRLWDTTGVAKLLERYPTRAGSPRLRSLVAAEVIGITREELGHRFLALIDASFLPRPVLNVPLVLGDRTFYPDCLWRDPRLIVELDSRAAHDTTSRFDSDRERDRLLTLAGFTVVRVTWRHATNDGRRLAADLRELIASRR